MNITKLSLAVLVTMSTVFISCENDNEDNEISIPSVYEFSRNGESTVDFSGQTTRLLQVNEIGSLLTTVNPIPTQQDFTNRFNQAVSFTDTSLNGSKNVRSKVAASVGLFANNASVSDAIKLEFDGYLTNQIAVLASTEEASQGVAGIYNGRRYFNEKGLEYNQAFYKGLIGALAIDQTLNHYFNRLDDNFDGSNNYRVDNNSGILVDGKNYTTMEHHFDEAYGYVYGVGESDKLLGHYLEEITGQAYFAETPAIVKNAFIKGRAAIVAKKYKLRDEAVATLRTEISKIPAARGIYYLQRAKDNINSQDPRAAFHALSEAYGFIYSLQFTYNTETNTPYFTRTEVEAILAKLYGGNGFYDLTVSKLEEISGDIVAKYDFSISEVMQ